MKSFPVLAAIAALGFTACDTMTGPLTGGDFDPLRPPGSTNSRIESGPSFKPGQFVRAGLDNTAFYSSRPKGNAEANKLLPRGASMKVVTTSGSYVKVELDSGEVGWVPSVMLEDPNAAAAPATLPPGQYQVYPPLPGAGVGEPLPVIDPAGLPPEGAIPAVMDPASVTDPAAPVPPADVAPDIPAPDITAPVVPAPPQPESVPLPPNEDDLKRMKESQ
jgi:hypothetical protein